MRHEFQVGRGHELGGIAALNELGQAKPEQEKIGTKK